MCDICNSYPHLKGCPNQPDLIVTRCDICGRDILEGDVYYRLRGEDWCETCVTDCIRTAELDEC